MPITSAVWEGGGAKGIAYARIPEALNDMGELQNIKRVAGSSCGSIMALFFALGYTPAQIDRITSELNFAEFMSKSYWRLLWAEGLSSGARLEEWIKWKIRVKTGSAYTTFDELYKSRGVFLVITGTNMTDRKTEYFSHRTTPDMELWRAVRISCALPIVFDPVIYNDKKYVDGGALMNFPIKVFDNEPNNQTIGFRFNYKRVVSRPAPSHILPFWRVAMDIVNIMVDRVYEYSSYDDSNRTAEINVYEMQATDCEIPLERKRLLKNNGYLATIRAIKRIRAAEEARCDSEIMVEVRPALEILRKARLAGSCG